MVHPLATIPQMVFARAKKYGTKTLLRSKREGVYQGISWKDFIADIEKLSCALIDQGIQP